MDQNIITELNKILPVVERVHGEHHPELHQVAELYRQLLAAPTEEVFARLRAVTGNYTAPEDACPTYRKTYRDLELLDQQR